MGDQSVLYATSRNGFINLLNLNQQAYIEYEAFPSPSQQPDDEANANPVKAAQYGVLSDGNYVSRELRTAAGIKGYCTLKFEKDLSKCYMRVQVEGFDVADLMMLHIHVGPANSSGPVIINIGQIINGDFAGSFNNGVLELTLTNQHVKAFNLGVPDDMQTGHGPIDATLEVVQINGYAFTAKTLAGLEFLCRLGFVYFNFHTSSERFFGLMRGQIYPKI